MWLPAGILTVSGQQRSSADTSDTHTILHCTSARFIAFDVRGQYKAFLRGDDADACNILGCHGFSS